MSGHASTTSSGSTRAMSAITRSGACDAVARDEPVLGKQPLELPAEEEVDPDQQDRRHARDGSTASRTPIIGPWGSTRGMRADSRRAPTSTRTRSSRTSGATRPTRSGTSSRGSSTSPSPGSTPSAATGHGCERQLAKADATARRRIARATAASTSTHVLEDVETARERRRGRLARASATAGSDQNAGSSPSHSRKRFR